MNISQKRFLAGAVTALFCALVAWATGYDFNERNPGVAFGLVSSAVFMLIAAGYPFREDE